MRNDQDIKLHGVVAEFSTEGAIIAAARKVREAGYRHTDCYTPYPVHGLAEAMHFKDNRIPWIIFFAALTGFIAGAAMQVYISYYDYPINSGGRPYISWPAFVPVAYECTILFGSFAALIGMLALCGLPRPYHSIFNTPNFERATTDRFFLSIEARDPKFDRVEARAFLESLGADQVSEVED